MPKTISNTSPLLHLYCIGVLEWLPKLLDSEGMTERIEPLIGRLNESGMWISDGKVYLPKATQRPDRLSLMGYESPD